jgi:hypothetical protein
MRIALIATPIVLLAACAEPIDRSRETESEAEPVAEPSEPAPAASLAPASDGTIPPSMLGKWGLVAADCTSTRGDAKGLIEVSEGEIRFYESVGKLDEVTSQDDDSFRANFAFTGEGMEWTRDVEWTIGDDGTTLTRSEFGEDALAEPLTYTKCS